VLAGRYEMLGWQRDDLANPDWFYDPKTDRRAPSSDYAFRIDCRSTSVGDIKQVWELSRHHHLTVLATAWYLTGEDEFAERVAAQLRSWWAENPFLSGVHWTSGIELGMRLIAWAWIRRLLDGWDGVEDLFERNEQALDQLYWHQAYLASFVSVGSSANNHVVAEAAGRLVGSCAFPWFDESTRWREGARAVLEAQLARNTFDSGVNRELATDYHAFVAELGLVAAVEADAAGHGLDGSTWHRLCLMADAAAAIVDEEGEAPRQGDSDDGRALVLDAPCIPRWSSFLAMAGAVFGPLPWWPEAPPTVASALVAALGGPSPVIPNRPTSRPSSFRDAGIHLLRSRDRGLPEIWCRCDGGPHGFLSIAGHAHADALAIEVRHGGVEILADPGTYCYHAEPEWRRYFRSTIAHNTIELGGRDQSESGGPFLWIRHAHTTELAGDLSCWSARHDGYRTLTPPATHTRAVALDDEQRSLRIVDMIDGAGAHPLRSALHLGPTVGVQLDGSRALLSWRGRVGPQYAELLLAPTLAWHVHHGGIDPLLGWHSPGFGTKQPTSALVGTGRCTPGRTELLTTLRFGDGPGERPADVVQDVLPASCNYSNPPVRP